MTEAGGGTFGMFTPYTTIGEVIRRYPAMRSWLPSLSTKYNVLTNPAAFRVMANVATLDMVANRGGFSTSAFLHYLEQWVARQENDQPDIAE